MYLIEVKNRAKAVKNLNQPPKFLPFLGMERILNWGRASPSLVGRSFFGDDTDVMGLKLADVPHFYAGPFDEKAISSISVKLARVEKYIAEQKELYDRLQVDLESDIRNIGSTINRYRQANSSPGYMEHLTKIGKFAVKIGKRPSIADDPLLASMANDVAKILKGKILKP